MQGKGLPVGRVGQSPRAICGSRRGVGDTADPESPEGQAARDGQGRVGLLQRGDRPLREEAGGRGPSRGAARLERGAERLAEERRGPEPSPGCGLTWGGWAGRGAAARSQVPGRRRPPRASQRPGRSGSGSGSSGHRDEALSQKGNGP